MIDDAKKIERKDGAALVPPAATKSEPPKQQSAPPSTQPSPLLGGAVAMIKGKEPSFDLPDPAKDAPSKQNRDKKKTWANREQNE